MTQVSERLAQGEGTPLADRSSLVLRFKDEEQEGKREKLDLEDSEAQWRELTLWRQIDFVLM